MEAVGEGVERAPGVPGVGANAEGGEQASVVMGAAPVDLGLSVGEGSGVVDLAGGGGAAELDWETQEGR